MGEARGVVRAVREERGERHVAWLKGVTGVRGSIRGLFSLVLCGVAPVPLGVADSHTFRVTAPIVPHVDHLPLCCYTASAS